MAVLTGQAKVSGGWSLAARVGANGSAMWRGQTMERDAWNRVRDYAESHQVLDLWSRVSEASRRYSAATGESGAAGLEESLSSNLTEMRRFEERASLARQESESWSEQAAQVRAEAQAIDRDPGQTFFSWLSEREGADGRPIGAAGAIRIASPQSSQRRKAYQSRCRKPRHKAAARLARTVHAMAAIQPDPMKCVPVASTGDAAVQRAASPGPPSTNKRSRQVVRRRVWNSVVMIVASRHAARSRREGWRSLSATLHD